LTAPPDDEAMDPDWDTEIDLSNWFIKTTKLQTIIMKCMRFPCRMPLPAMQTRHTKGHDQPKKSSKQERDAG
jgi:hypothetical protein